MHVRAHAEVLTYGCWRRMAETFFEATKDWVFEGLGFCDWVVALKLKNCLREAKTKGALAPLGAVRRRCEAPMSGTGA